MYQFNQPKQIITPIKFAPFVIMLVNAPVINLEAPFKFTL